MCKKMTASSATTLLAMDSIHDGNCNDGSGSSPLTPEDFMTPRETFELEESYPNIDPPSQNEDEDSLAEEISSVLEGNGAMEEDAMKDVLNMVVDEEIVVGGKSDAESESDFSSLTPNDGIVRICVAL